MHGQQNNKICLEMLLIRYLQHPAWKKETARISETSRKVQWNAVSSLINAKQALHTTMTLLT